MAQMTDPHNGLVSFQAALLGGHIQPRVCSKHQDLSFLYEGSSQKTESMVTPVFATPILTTSWLA